MKNTLKQYNSLKREIKELKVKIDYISNISEVEIDIVSGSSVEYPYLPRNFKVESFNNKGNDRIDSLLNILTERVYKCEKLKLDIEKFISEIEDSELRLIFQYRYINEMTWIQIAFKIGHYDESYPRKKHNKYNREVIK